MISYYDSGIGGLSIVKEVLRLVPDLDIQYFCDYKFLPLGNKTSEQILQRLKDVCTFLFENSDLVILVCNTASVNSIRHLQQVWLPEHFPKKQILGVSKPAVELLTEQYSSYKDSFNLITSTIATHRSGFYQKEFKLSGFGNVISIPSPTLCPEIENKDTESIIESINIIKESIGSQNPSLILLACTHYPFALKTFETIFPNSIIVDPSSFIASKNIDYISRHPEYKSTNNSKLKVITSLPFPNLKSKICEILGREDFELSESNV
jgi:glutamate racemase